eukprot:5565319-Amphidinium_carterae.2
MAKHLTNTSNDDDKHGSTGSCLCRSIVIRKCTPLVQVAGRLEPCHALLVALLQPLYAVPKSNNNK